MRPIDKFFEDALAAVRAEGPLISRLTLVGELPKLDDRVEDTERYHPDRPDEVIACEYWPLEGEHEGLVLSEAFVRECMEGRLKDDREPAKILFDLVKGFVGYREDFWTLVD